jgi:putative ABC transport system substrate-binding protein
MAIRIGRRQFISALGGTAVAWPLVASAQQPAMPVIGYLSVAARDINPEVAFRQGLAESEFVEGRNVSIEYRWANGRHDLLQNMATELVNRGVNLIAAFGASSAARAAKAATSTIPIVFAMGDTDPVQAGIVPSLSRPGANITGVSLMGGALGVKRVGLLRDLLPDATGFAVLANPKNPISEPDVSDVETAVRASGLRPIMIEASDPSQFDAAFTSMAQQHANALVVTADPFFTVHREELVVFAARYRIPAIYQWRLFPAVGGLMSYGASVADAERQVGVYAGRILRGAKPGDLPVLQPTKFEFVVNLKTAKELGLTFPPGMLAIADDVIE